MKFAKTTLVLAICLITGLANAAQKQAAPAAKSGGPDATLNLRGGSFAVGIGFGWSKGTLTYKGHDYPVKVDGLSIGKVGISGASATGSVYNLKKLSDFEGHYTAIGAGITLAGGAHASTMGNQHGVKINLTSTTKGLDIAVGGGGVDMKFRK